jgi:hypothetical protein
MRFAFVLVFLAACGTKSGGGGGDCADAVSHAQSISEKGMPSGIDPKMAERMKATMVAATKAMTDACTTDSWSPDVVACLKGAKEVQEAFVGRAAGNECRRRDGDRLERRGEV